jgi:tRNA (guanine-N7-)-methyltransferase
MTQLPTAPAECPPSSETQPEVLPAGWAGPDAAPLEIDVGCHKGLFLVEMASRYPERNFLGIERQAERVAKTKKKIASVGLTNATAVCAEGLESLKNVPPACVDHVHVLFPDPWPKRRHHSRRLVQAAFLDRCHLILKPAGMLRLVTDDESYASAMRTVAGEDPRFVEQAGEDREYPLTEFQKKFLEDGRPFYTLLLRRAGS